MTYFFSFPLQGIRYNVLSVKTLSNWGGKKAKVFRAIEDQGKKYHPWGSPGKNTGVGCHFLLQCMKVKSESEVAQSCPTLRNPMDCSLPGSCTHGIFQARVLEWVAIAFSSLSPSILLLQRESLTFHAPSPWPEPCLLCPGTSSLFAQPYSPRADLPSLLLFY